MHFCNICSSFFLFYFFLSVLFLRSFFVVAYTFTNCAQCAVYFRKKLTNGMQTVFPVPCPGELLKWHCNYAKGPAKWAVSASEPPSGGV